MSKKRPKVIQPWQIQMIHTVRRAMWGDNREPYEQLLGGVYGAGSCKDLSYGEANDFINRLKAIQKGDPKPLKVRGGLWATVGQVHKIDALAWMLGWEGDENRLNGFIKKQTGRNKNKWMLTGREATKIIIGLQRWISGGDGATYYWLNSAMPGVLRTKQGQQIKQRLSHES